MAKEGQYLVPKKDWWARMTPGGIPLQGSSHLAYDHNSPYQIKEDRGGAYGTDKGSLRVYIMHVDAVVRPTLEEALDYIQRRTKREVKSITTGNSS